MHLRPLKDRLLVKQRPAQEKIGGIYVPQGKEAYENIGEVLAVGPEVKDVKKDDVVLFVRRPASHLGEYYPELKDVLLLKEEDISGVVED